MDSLRGDHGRVIAIVIQTHAGAGIVCATQPDLKRLAKFRKSTSTNTYLFLSGLTNFH